MIKPTVMSLYFLCTDKLQLFIELNSPAAYNIREDVSLLQLIQASVQECQLFFFILKHFMCPPCLLKFVDELLHGVGDELPGHLHIGTPCAECHRSTSKGSNTRMKSYRLLLNINTNPELLAVLVLT